MDAKTREFFEFCDNDGRTYASLALKASQLIVLHHEAVEAA